MAKPKWYVKQRAGKAEYQDSAVALGVRVVYTPYGIVLVCMEPHGYFCSFTAQGHGYIGRLEITNLKEMHMAWPVVVKSFMRALRREYPRLRRS